MGILGWIATAKWSARFLGWTKLPEWARGQLQRQTGVVMARGLEFFPTREILDRARTYDELLARAEKIDAAYVTGRKISEHDIPNIRHIHRVILPDPRSKSLVSYAIGIVNSPELQGYIIRATQDAKEKYGIEVRWYPEMYHASFMVGDSVKKSGWVHIELTLPFSKPNRRPSFTVTKDRCEETVAEFAHVFEQMWKASRPPDEAYLIERESRPIIDLRDLDVSR